MKLILRGLLLMTAFLATMNGGAVSSSPNKNSTEDLEEQIRAVIVQRHPKNTAQWWIDLGNGAVPAILNLLKDPSTTTAQRVTLLGALKFYKDSRSSAVLTREAQSGKSLIIRETALSTIAQSDGVANRKLLIGALKDHQPRLRLAAALALRNLKVNADPSVKGEIESALKGFEERERQRWVVDRYKLAH